LRLLTQLLDLLEIRMAALIFTAGSKQVATGVLAPPLSPTQLPGLQLWMDAMDPNGTGTPPANGATLTTVADKSGNGRTGTFYNRTYTFTQLFTGVNTANATYTAGAYPFITPNFAQSSFLGSFIPAGTFLSAASIFFVYKTTNTAGPAFTRTIPPASGQAGNLGNPIDQQGTFYYIGSNNAQSFNVTPYTPYNTNTFINNLNINQSPQSISVFSNGNSLYSSTGTWTASDGGNFLTFFGRGDGGSSIMAGNMNEILVYNSVLTAPLRQAIEGYLAWKWNIVSSLPVGHPYRTSAPTSNTVPTTFFPTYIPGIQLWLDGADPLATGTPPANGTAITTWSDKSGNGRNGTGTGSPAYVSASSNISFNGSQYFTTAYTSFAPAETIFVVYNITNNTSQAALVDTNSSGGRSFQHFAGNGPSLASSGIAWRATGTLPITSGVTYIAGVSYSTAGISIFVNGLLSVTNATNPSFTAGTTTIGYGNFNSFYLTGSISEIIIYNAVLSTSQRQIVEGYLAWKWNMRTSLAINHPFRNFVPTINSIITTANYTYSASHLPGLQAWYDAADPLGTGVQPANGTVISNWVDKAGESLNPMIATGSPTYTTASQNGLPGITVSGNSGTTITSFFQTYIPPGTFLAELDAYVVYKNVSAVTFNTVINRTTLATGNFANPLDSYGTAYTAGLSNAVNVTGSYNLYNTTTSIFNINVSQNTASSSRLTGYTNGTPITFTGTSTGWTPSDIGNILTLGSRGDRATGFNGLFYEVMVFNAAFSTGGRQYVEGYLAWKWGLQASLPTTHPYYQAAPNITTLYFQPDQIVGINVWLDGTDPFNTGILPANGATVTTWFDKSPNAFSATGAGSPTYNLTTRTMTTIASSWFTVPYSGLHPIETGFVVANITTPSTENSAQTLIVSGAGNGSRGFIQYVNNIQIQTTNTANYGYTTTNSVPAGSFGLYGYTYNSNAGFVYQNGVVGSFSASGMNPISDTFFYTSAGNAGSLAEVILFNTVLTTAERQVVEGYLAWKWGIQSSLPAAHPYRTIQPSLLTFIPSYTNTSNISANAESYVPLMSNTLDIGNSPQTIGSNGTLSFSNVLGKNCVFINNSTANFVSVPIANPLFFTVAFWFHYTSTNYFTVASYTTPSGTMAMQFDLVSAGSNIIYTSLPTQWTNIPGSTNLGANTWNFIAITVNQNTFVENLYMNGALAATATGSGPFPGSPSLFVLGKSGDGNVFPSGGTRSYQGFLQNFMYFNTVLTAAQVATIYEQTALDLTVASQPTSLSLTFANPTLTFSWTAGANTTSYVVTFYGVATNTNVGGVLLATFTTTTTSQTYNPTGYTFYYAIVTPTNSGFLGVRATSSAVAPTPSPPTGVTMGSFAAQQTTISASWTAGAGATSYTVNFLSNAANSTSGGTVWQTITGVTGTSQTSSTTLRSGSNGTYYYATVTSVNAGGSSTAATSSGNIRYYIPNWINGLVLWLDANDSSTYTLSGSTLTSPGWKDKVGNRYFLTNNGGTSNVQAGRANPVLTNLSGYNSFFFNNSSASPSSNSVGAQTNLSSSPLIFPTQNITYFMVSQDQGTNTNSQYRAAIQMGTRQIATRPNYNMFFHTTIYEGFSVSQDYNGSSWGRSLNTNLPSVTYTKKVLVGTSSNAYTTVHQNGTSLYSNATVYNSPYTNIPMCQLGIAVNENGGRCWGGYMFEFMIYSTGISPTNRQILEGWLAWKWGTQGSLAAGHPYLSASP